MSYDTVFLAFWTFVVGIKITPTYRVVELPGQPSRSVGPELRLFCIRHNLSSGGTQTFLALFSIFHMGDLTSLAAKNFTSNDEEPMTSATDTILRRP